MRHLATVAVTIAGLVVCPSVCWMHAMGDCAPAAEKVADRAGAGCCGCCCDGPAQPAPETPQPERPAGDQGASCICKGGTVASKSDAPPQETGGCLHASLPVTDTALQVPAPAEHAVDVFYPVANAPPTGRALRILLQSFLA